MTIVNVNRSLTICSIINSFLKVIVWMRLVATPGSFFVGDPSGGPPRDLLLVANKKNHLVPDKSKTMILATQVAKPSLVLSLPTTTVSNSTRTITNHHQKKKKIIGLFVENINLEDCLEDLALRYRNVTSSRNVLVNREDTFLSIRPSFPFFPSTDKYILDGDEEEFFFTNNNHSNPLPFAEVLDRISAALFDGVERVAEWNDDFFGNLFWRIQQEWRRTVAIVDVGFTKMKQAAKSCPLSVSSIYENSFLLHSLCMYCDMVYCYLCFIFSHRIVKELGPFALLLIIFLAAFDSIYLSVIWLLRRGFIWFKRRSRQVSYYCKFNSVGSPQRQVVVSRKRSYNFRREILPFEWHSMSTRLSYKRYRCMLWLQEQYRGNHEKYMRARKFHRDAEFFNKANRGRCALQVGGVFIEQILEEDDEITAEGVSCGGKENNGFEEVYSLGAEDEVAEEGYLKNIAEEGVTTTSASSRCGSENPEFDSDNHVCDKNQEEVVRTLFVAESKMVLPPRVVVLEAPTPKPTVDPLANLGSGFYIDSMGRTRRYSHRLLAEKKVANK